MNGTWNVPTTLTSVGHVNDPPAGGKSLLPLHVRHERGIASSRSHRRSEEIGAVVGKREIDVVTLAKSVGASGEIHALGERGDIWFSAGLLREYGDESCDKTLPCRCVRLAPIVAYTPAVQGLRPLQT